MSYLFLFSQQCDTVSKRSSSNPPWQQASSLLKCPRATLNHPPAMCSLCSWSCSLFFALEGGRANDELLCHRSIEHHKNKSDFKVERMHRLIHYYLVERTLGLVLLIDSSATGSWDSQCRGYNRCGSCDKVTVALAAPEEQSLFLFYFSLYINAYNRGISHGVSQFE